MLARAILIGGTRTVACLGDKADSVHRAALAVDVELAGPAGVAVDAHALGGHADCSLVDTFFCVRD